MTTTPEYPKVTIVIEDSEHRRTITIPQVRDMGFESKVPDPLLVRGSGFIINPDPDLEILINMFPIKQTDGIRFTETIEEKN